MGIESPIIGLMITIPWYMGQNGKLDPSTYCISMFSVNVFHQSGKPWHSQTKDASHHQDDIPFLVGDPNLYKPSFATGILGGG